MGVPTDANDFHVNREGHRVGDLKVTNTGRNIQIGKPAEKWRNLD